MIFYFTGTGNSRYIADVINETVKDEVVSINTYIKNGETGDFHSEKPLVFILPVYAWRMPKIVDKFIKHSTFTGCKDVYFVLNCGSSSGDSVKYAKKLAEKIGLNFNGFITIVMPENYIAMFNTPDNETAKEIISKAMPRIQAAAKKIKNGETLPKEPISKVWKVASDLVNPLFYPMSVSSKAFYVEEDMCIGCGECAQVCPTNCITIVDGEPKWGENCTHCMGCISHCLTQCIEYGKKTQGKNRYVNNYKANFSYTKELNGLE